MEWWVRSDKKIVVNAWKTRYFSVSEFTHHWPVIVCNGTGLRSDDVLPTPPCHFSWMSNKKVWSHFIPQMLRKKKKLKRIKDTHFLTAKEIDSPFGKRTRAHVLSSFFYFFLETFQRGFFLTFIRGSLCCFFSACIIALFYYCAERLISQMSVRFLHNCMGFFVFLFFAPTLWFASELIVLNAVSQHNSFQIHINIRFIVIESTHKVTKNMR